MFLINYIRPEYCLENTVIKLTILKYEKHMGKNITHVTSQNSANTKSKHVTSRSRQIKQIHSIWVKEQIL